MLKPFPLSLQETFDLAYNGVVAQGSKCCKIVEDNIPACVYIGEDNKRCAAGHIFGFIEPSFDLGAVDDAGGASGQEVLSLMGYWDKYNTQSAPNFIRLISQVQAAHDESEMLRDSSGNNFVDSFSSKMRMVAERFGLKVPGV